MYLPLVHISFFRTYLLTPFRQSTTLSLLSHSLLHPVSKLSTTIPNRLDTAPILSWSFTTHRIPSYISNRYYKIFKYMFHPLSAALDDDKHPPSLFTRPRRPVSQIFTYQMYHVTTRPILKPKSHSSRFLLIRPCCKVI